MTVDVTAEDGRDVARQLRTRDHVRTLQEREVSGTARRALDTVVQAEQPHVGRRRTGASCREQFPEPVTDVLAYGNPVNATRTPPASSTTVRGRSKTWRFR